jgi:hypothetical protein
MYGDGACATTNMLFLFVLKTMKIKISHSSDPGNDALEGAPKQKRLLTKGKKTIQQN